MKNSTPTRFVAEIQKVCLKLTGQRFTIYLVPALSLAAFWLGGETALLTVAVSVPLLAGAMAALGDPLRNKDLRDQGGHVMGPELFNRLVQVELDVCRAEGRKSAVVML